MYATDMQHARGAPCSRCVRTYIYVHMYICTYIHLHSTYMHIHMFSYVYYNMCICKHMWSWASRKRITMWKIDIGISMCNINIS